MKFYKNINELVESLTKDIITDKYEIEEFDVDIPQSKREIYVCEEQVEYGPGYSTGEIRNDCYYRDDYESNSYYYLFNHNNNRNRRDLISSIFLRKEPINYATLNESS